MRKLLGILGFLALSFVAAAQGAIEMTAPNLVAADEQFNVTFKIDGDKAPSDFEWSPGDDFKLVWGPQKGSSSSISIVNGKTTRQSTTTYTYVLMPRSTGTFTLAAATATVKGKKVSSGTRSIQVVGGGQQGSQAGGQASSGSSSSGTVQEVSGDDIFLRLTLSKNSAVVGEGITATLKLYTRVQVAGFEDARFPTFDGFWSQQLQAPQNIQFQRENVGGQIYDAALLRSWTLIPQRSGEIAIDPAELVCLVNVRNNASRSGSIFDSFFQDEYRTIRKRVRTPARTVKVNPLPAGAPASFGGGVGKFSMKASLSRDSLKTHDAASLLVSVSGSGNIALLEAPKVVFPPDFEVYDVKTTEKGGVKTFEYPFIPRSHGSFTIGPVEYSYYDIAQGRYVTLRSAEMPLEVIKSSTSADTTVPQEGSLQLPEKKDVKDLGSDIRFIATRVPAFASPGTFLVWSPLFWGLTGALLLLAAALYFGLRKRAELRADVVRTRNRGAARMARKRLATAGDFLKKNLDTAFYEELHRALLGFAADKLAMDSSDMSRENILARLQTAGVPEALAEDFCGLLEQCEYARYAPAAGHEAMSAQYEKAVSVVSGIDSAIGRKTLPKAGLAALALLLLPIGMQASESYADSLWTAGVQAYSAADYQGAVRAWAALEQAGLASPELYTNEGDAYFKTEDYARAILCYERALKMDPSYADARYNLALANSRVQDRIESVPEFFLVSWMRALGWKLSSDAWAVLFLVLLAGTLALALLFLLGRSSAARKTGFFIGIVLLLLSLTSLGFSSWQRREYQKADKAIVMSPVMAVKSAPGAGDGKDLFILHEGTKVRVTDSVSGWVNVELADGRQGWMREDNLEKV